ncbi:hypothetical protein [Dyella nitratireducens]|uniref:Uncharacterized protein n=1 Tax=Dyella nitratireducens TaxID=1849580 RepID=A0ABQ1GIM8_9GAMM|nr:hypothetical protein [Dyella nitratireducens]GGA44615.1 hypothetical protein GCM10010981_37240 [Dyella nitratireducens]GLQ41719.1 hypothetical protein GCM10007902_15690 [Dyella nitratireducens]
MSDASAVSGAQVETGAGASNGGGSPSIDISRVVKASATITGALESLNSDERQRVLQAAAALFGVDVFVADDRREKAEDRDDRDSDSGQKRKSSKRQSIVEFLEGCNPATNPQRIACFAYYRDKVEGNENFARGDLSGYFAQAKLPAPGSNYARDYNLAVREGWIHDEGTKSYLTQKGEKAVEAGFEGKAKARGAAATKKRRGKKAE